MKNRIITVLLVLLSSALFAQVQGFGTYKISNSTIPIGLNLAKGSIIFDTSTGDIYILKKHESATATLSGMVSGVDYVSYIPITGSNSITGDLTPIGIAYADLGTSSHPWYHVYATNFYSDTISVNGGGSFTGNLTTNGDLIVKNVSNPFVNLKDDAYSTEWYIQAYNDKLALGAGLVNSVVVDKTGNLTVPNAGSFGGDVTAADFVLSSDSTLKHDIKPVNVDVSKIPLIQFKFKADSTNRERYGVIAQTLQKVAPEMVYKGSDGKLKVSYIGFLIARLSNDESKIDSLKSVVNKQQIMLNDLMKRVKALEDEK